MNVLIAPNNYKNSISASNAALAIESGLRSVAKRINTIHAPLSDGGEGFVDALVNAMSGSIINCNVRDPLGRIIDSYYGSLNAETAVIEMALASGLERLTENEKNLWITTTYGTGELILNAIRRGYKQLLIGIGGSATNDVGLGMLIAVGAEFFNSLNQPIELGNAQSLSQVSRIEKNKIESLFKDISLTVACDVTNPLFGPQGATCVYGPQKGANQELVKKIESGVLHFHKKTRDYLGVDHSQTPGSGAAGGLGYASMTYLNAQMRPGFDIVADSISLVTKIQWADLIITGEGKVDSQTKQGKVISRLAKLSKEHHKRLIVIGGLIEENLQIDGVRDYFSIRSCATDNHDSMLNAGRYLFDIGSKIARRL